MANNIPGWGGQPAKKSSIRLNKTIKRNKPKKGIKQRTANNRFRSLAFIRNSTLRNKLNKVRGLTRSNKSGNLRAIAAAAAANGNENRNENENENENDNENENENGNGVGLNLGGGGGGLFEPLPIHRPKAIRAYPPPVAAPAPLKGRNRSNAFNMANFEAALPPLNLGPAAAGGGGPAKPRSLRNNNNENELRHRKTRKLNRAL